MLMVWSIALANKVVLIRSDTSTSPVPSPSPSPGPGPGPVISNATGIGLPLCPGFVIPEDNFCLTLEINKLVIENVLVGTV